LSADLRQLVGIDLPIIQAPMAGSQGSALAVAVSNAGGLGSLPCAMLGPDGMRAQLAAIRAQTTKPYNVNFFCHRQPEPDEAREAAWRAALAPYLREFDIEAAAARGIVNRVMRELGPMGNMVPAFPLAASAIAPLRSRAEARGSGDFSPLWAGQNPTGCKEVSAGLLTRELAAT
jgi:NAD(P)H-dependent flavin oxidoreductase YrpB (nitropropane dioxygenase family)